MTHLPSPEENKCPPRVLEDIWKERGRESWICTELCASVNEKETANEVAVFAPHGYCCYSSSQTLRQRGSVNIQKWHSTHTEGSHWEGFTSCCCWIGIIHKCLHCNNIDYIQGECVCGGVVCVCNRVWDASLLFITHQMVWWCASHLVCVLGWWQREWETSSLKVWDHIQKDVSSWYVCTLMCVCLFVCMCSCMQQVCLTLPMW